jgi:hypothetical protein
VLGLAPALLAYSPALSLGSGFLEVKAVFDAVRGSGALVAAFGL